MPDSDLTLSSDDPPALLTNHPFFSLLSSAEIKTVTRRLKRLTFAPSTVLMREGELGDCLYILAGGSVEIIKALGTPDQRSLGLRGPGDIIGEMSLIDPTERRSASVRAQTTVDVWLMTGQDFDALLRQYPRLNLHMLRVLSRRLRTTESTTIRELKEKNRELNQAYLELKAAQQKLVEQEVLARELAHAQRIQLQMLPVTLPHFAGAEIGAAILAAHSVGGDLYEVIRLGPDRVALAIGDVAGKGIPAALYMALVSSLLRAEARPDVPPETVVRRINRHLCERDMESMFVTLLYSELNLQTRQLHIVRAGHERPLLWAGEASVPLAADGRSIPLGLLAEPPLDVQEISLPAAATLLLYTDGVTDATNPTFIPFGRSRLLSFVERSLSLSAQALCNALVQAVLAHQEIMPQFDDVTVLALRLD